MSLLTTSQATGAKGATRAARGRARRRAKRAAVQAGPLTAAARATARKGIHHARTWTAPRLERAGHAVTDQVAPRMAAMLSAAARRIDPDPVRSRRRWPVLAAGLVTAAGLSATAAYLLRRRGAATPVPTLHDDAMTTSRDGAAASAPAAESPVGATDLNGRVRAS